MNRKALLLILLASTFASAQPIAERDLRVRDDKSRTAGLAVPHGYALIIGITDYANIPKNDLRFPESDADAVYRVLISAEGGAFPAENVHRLIGRQATLANIRHEVEEWLPAVAKPEDRVVVYFAGHGLIYQGKGYLAPWDVDLSRIDETAYSMHGLGNTLANRVKARWKALFTDACHSGKINAETTNETVASQMDFANGQFLSFAATIGRERSYEDANLSSGFGLFSYFLTQALRGAADNNPCDGVITADELIEYVRSEVRRYAQSAGVSQTPHAASDYDPAMVLGVSRGCGATAVPSSLSGTAVIEADADDVSVFVDDTLVGKVRRGAPLSVPGLASGPHIVRGAKDGYKPEIKQITILPGQAATFTIRMRYPKAIKRSALDLGADGEKLLYTSRSTINPVNILPVARSQSEADLKRARELFRRALEEDPSYSMAAYHLGVVNQLLSNEEASKEAFRRSIELDPTYVPARLEYAGVLIESGDPDEAIRHLTEALRLDKSNDQAYAQLAVAYWNKSAWQRCVESADNALRLDASNAMAHLWRADCIRLSAPSRPAGEPRTAAYGQARESYQSFLNATNISTPVYQWLAFHFVGFHLGSRRHADRTDSYNNLRASGYLGLCLCEQKTGNLLRAREYCARALRYLPDDAIGHFLLANVHRDLFNRTKGCEDILAARSGYQKVISLNPDLAEARNARAYLEQIESMAGALRRIGCRL